MLTDKHMHVLTKHTQHTTDTHIHTHTCRHTHTDTHTHLLNLLLCSPCPLGTLGRIYTCDGSSVGSALLGYWFIRALYSSVHNCFCAVPLVHTETHTHTETHSYKRHTLTETHSYRDTLLQRHTHTETLTQRHTHTETHSHGDTLTR